MATEGPVSPEGSCTHSPTWDCVPTVSVLVLNWNGERFLRPCLSSLLQDVCRHIEIILVDNGSHDGSPDLVRQEFPTVRVVANGSNLGFSLGYDAAVPVARGDFLVFLNNDVVVERGWLPPLVDVLLDNPHVGITTPKLLLYGTRTLNNAGGYLKLWTGVGEIGYGCDEKLFPEGRDIQPFYASGAAMAMRRDLFQRLGGFDARIFSYGEDLDLSWRARLAGYTVCYVPASVVHHRFSGSWGVFNPDKLRMVTRHQIRGMVKCLSWPNLLHSAPAYMLFALAKGLALSIVMRSLAYCGSVLSAFGDTLRDSGDLWRQRRESQRLRAVPDRKALKSEGFGLFDAPWHFWKVLRVAQKVSREGPGQTRTRS